MEQVDPALAARVWQRVRQGPGEELETLLVRKLETAGLYRALARQLPGEKVLLRLAVEEQAQADCLRGLCLLLGRPDAPSVPPPAKEPVEGMLRRCCFREAHSLRQLESRGFDGDFAPVFARLAVQEAEHCRLALELLGRYESRRLK